MADNGVLVPRVDLGHPSGVQLDVHQRDSGLLPRHGAHARHHLRERDIFCNAIKQLKKKEIELFAIEKNKQTGRRDRPSPLSPPSTPHPPNVALFLKPWRALGMACLLRVGVLSHNLPLEKHPRAGAKTARLPVFQRKRVVHVEGFQGSPPRYVKSFEVESVAEEV